MKPLLVDTAQLAVCAGYALALDRYKHLWEPDFTWLEVVTGNAICLAAASIRVAATPDATANDALQATWRAFAIGGVPIITWRLYRMYTMHQRGFAAALAHLKASPTDAETR